MASYRQLQSTYAYFCQTGPPNDVDISLGAISTSSTFWNGVSANLERGFSCITTNTANGLVFTAPVKGLYYFKIILNCINQSATGTDNANWGITVTKGSTSTNRFITDNPDNMATQSVEYNTQFSTIAYLSANDTVKMYGTGSSSVERWLANRCYFMGYLIAGFE